MAEQLLEERLALHRRKSFDPGSLHLEDIQDRSTCDRMGHQHRPGNLWQEIGRLMAGRALDLTSRDHRPHLQRRDPLAQYNRKRFGGLGAVGKERYVALRLDLEAVERKQLERLGREGEIGMGKKPTASKIAVGGDLAMPALFDQHRPENA